MPRLFLPALLLVAGLCASCKPAPAPLTKATPTPTSPVSFTHQVRPILANKCLPCHGSFAAGNTSGIRLDTASHATTVRPESGAAPVVPGDPQNSSLLRKLFVADPSVADQQATDPNHTITPEEYQILQTWIAHRAPYEPHWAFQPLPADVPVPPTDSTWPRSPIDHFTLQNISGKAPAPPSTPLRWLHRASLDLTGLPPNPEILADFEQALLVPNNEGQAMWHAADQLLSSQAFGEHLATRWLQHARYSDFLTPDRRNSQSPYRDWVIDAFNRNLPYNEFLTEQLAGDLLPNTTRQRQLATAFLRLHPLDPATTSPREDSTASRTEAFARAMLGLDLRCAKCHHHPSDPLTTTDHHSLLAFFENPDESGLLPPVGVTPAPTLLLPTRPQAEHLLIATQREANTSNEFTRTITDGEPSLAAWIVAPDKLPLISDLIGAFSFDGEKGRSENQALGHLGHASYPKLSSTPGIRGKALKLDGTTSVPILDLLPLTRSTPRTFSFWLQMPKVPEEHITLLSRRNHLGRGFELRLEAGQLSARLAREWPGNAIGIRSTNAVLTPATWHQITCTYDGSSTADGLQLSLDGRPLTTTITTDHIWKALFENKIPPLDFPAHPALKDSLLDDFQIFSRALTPLEVENLYDGRALTAAVATNDPQQLRPYYFSSIHPESRKLRQTLSSLRHAVVTAETPLAEVSIMREPTTPAHPRSTPSFLPPLTTANPNRLNLANWLTQPNHPLTARVFVNRLWENFFNEGLVASTENLGLTSPPNTNPALLDWLARDFVNHNWDTKRLCRQIVLSATYRQTSSHPLDPIRLRDRSLAVLGADDQARTLYTPWITPPPSDTPSLCPESPSAPLPVPSPAPLGEAKRLIIANSLAAQALQIESNTDSARLTHIFHTLTGRPPTNDELATLGNTLREEKSLRKDDSQASPDDAQLFWAKLCLTFLDSPAASLK